MHLPENIQILLIDLDEMIVEVKLFLDTGPFKGSNVDFRLNVPAMYPHTPPKVKILQKVIIFLKKAYLQSFLFYTMNKDISSKF